MIMWVQAILARGSDESETIIQIIMFVIIAVIGVVSNLAKAKTKKTGMSSRKLHPKRVLPSPSSSEDDVLLEAITEPSGGGFAEVLSPRGKSSFERFIELKDKPISKLPNLQDNAVFGKDIESLQASLDDEMFAAAAAADDDDADDELEFDAQSIANAVIYRELLDLPLALRQGQASLL